MVARSIRDTCSYSLISSRPQDTMIYEPKHKSIDDILLLAGFTRDHKGSLGWIRYWSTPTQKKDCIVVRANRRTSSKGRLHALTHRGNIDLHWDEEADGKHLTRKIAREVKDCIKEFKKIDIVS